MIKARVTTCCLCVMLLPGCALYGRDTYVQADSDEAHAGRVGERAAYEEYRNIVGDHLQKYIDPACAIEDAGFVYLVLKLNREGALLSFRVNQGNTDAPKNLVDRAIQSLNRADPFPPIPEEVESQRKAVLFRVRIRYGERQ